MALSEHACQYATKTDRSAFFEKALRDANAATALAPELGEAHLASAFILHDRLDFAAAGLEYKQALRLAPGNVRVLRNYGLFAAEMGQTELGLSMIRHSLVLDPLNVNAYGQLGDVLTDAGRYREAISAYQQSAKDSSSTGSAIAWAYYKLGDLQSAELWATKERLGYARKAMLTVIYNGLGRKADAAAMLSDLEREIGNAKPFILAQVCAVVGDRARALDWLEEAFRSHDPDLIQLKADDAIATLRNEPRFQAIERELKFPN